MKKKNECMTKLRTHSRLVSGDIFQTKLLPLNRIKTERMLHEWISRESQRAVDDHCLLRNNQNASNAIKDRLNRNGPTFRSVNNCLLWSRKRSGLFIKGRIFLHLHRQKQVKSQMAPRLLRSSPACGRSTSCTA